MGDCERKWRNQLARRQSNHVTSDELLDMVVALYCKSGKHRSVAVATCLEHILLTEEKFEAEVKHLSERGWGFRICRGTCAECRSDSDEEKQSALRRAAEIWATRGRPLAA